MCKGKGGVDGCVTVIICQEGVLVSNSSSDKQYLQPHCILKAEAGVPREGETPADKLYSQPQSCI